eukprot:4408739-Prymnesium_polylepis.1
MRWDLPAVRVPRRRRAGSRRRAGLTADAVASGVWRGPWRSRAPRPGFCRRRGGMRLAGSRRVA